MGINEAEPEARLHISDDLTNCTPTILINAYANTSGTTGEGPYGPGVGGESEETCTTPYVFRVKTSDGTNTSINVNLDASGAMRLGSIWDFASVVSTMLSVKDNMGMYRSEDRYLRLGFPFSSNEPSLNWSHDESSPFHISYGESMHNAKKLMTFLPGGNVGVGTVNPISAMHIVSELPEPNTGETGQIQGLLIENNGWRDHDFALEIRTGQANDFGGRVFTVSNAGTVHIGPSLNGAIPDMGEGTFNLYVEKGIRTERVRVDVAEENGWADYVFDDDYVLMPIAELEAYIKEHRHLPGVPSAETVAEEGIDLAEMNKILLEKVEELTLRLIEQEKRLANLEN